MLIQTARLKKILIMFNNYLIYDQFTTAVANTTTTTEPTTSVSMQNTAAPKSGKQEILYITFQKMYNCFSLTVDGMRLIKMK